MRDANAEVVVMSTVYNPEAQIMEEIERLELEARNIRRKIEHVTNESDKRVMNRQLKELDEEITLLQARLP
jgi:hypothetical protein